MFENIGGKIKMLAKVLCWIGVIASVITAIIMFKAAGESYRTEGLFIGLGFAFLIGGPLTSWISSFICYGFGELVENSNIIAKNTTANYKENNLNSFVNNHCTSNEPPKSYQSIHRWSCSKCGEMIDKYPCPLCGYEPQNDNYSENNEVLE